VTTTTNGNGEKKMLWKALTILMIVVTTLIGTVWGVTYGANSKRLSSAEMVIAKQQDRLARIETKIDILLDGMDK